MAERREIFDHVKELTDLDPPALQALSPLRVVPATQKFRKNL